MRVDLVKTMKEKISKGNGKGSEGADADYTNGQQSEEFGKRIAKERSDLIGVVQSCEEDSHQCADLDGGIHLHGGIKIEISNQENASDYICEAD